VRLVDESWFKAPDFKTLKDSLPLRYRGDKEKILALLKPLTSGMGYSDS